MSEIQTTTLAQLAERANSEHRAAEAKAREAIEHAHQAGRLPEGAQDSPEGAHLSPSPQQPEHLEPLWDNQQLTSGRNGPISKGAQVVRDRGKPEHLRVTAIIEQAITGLPMTVTQLLDELDPEDVEDIAAGDMTAVNVRAVAQSIIEHRE